MTALVGGLGVGGIEQKRERTHGHRQQCGDCRVGVEVEESTGGINGNGKNTIK